MILGFPEEFEDNPPSLFHLLSDPLTAEQHHIIILPVPCWTVGVLFVRLRPHLLSSKHIDAHCGQTTTNQKKLLSNTAASQLMLMWNTLDWTPTPVFQQLLIYCNYFFGFWLTLVHPDQCSLSSRWYFVFWSWQWHNCAMHFILTDSWPKRVLLKWAQKNQQLVSIRITHRPEVQLPHPTTLWPFCCLLSDPFGTKVALNTPLWYAAYSTVACTFCACGRCNKRVRVSPNASDLQRLDWCVPALIGRGMR